MRTITLAKGGTREREILVSQIKIPDLWHIANRQENIHDREQILETWTLAHAMLRELRKDKHD